MNTVTFTASKDATTIVEIDDLTLVKSEPLSGLTDDQVQRLKDLKGLTFTVAPDRKPTTKES